MRSVLLALASLALATLTAAQYAAAAAYAPTVEACPHGIELIRQVSADNQSLSSGEASYITQRQERVLPGAWQAYLESVEGTTSARNLPSYVSDILDGEHGVDALPRFSIATSGGSYRAAIFGAGVLNQLDGRNASSVAFGTGGLLQAATYLAGLSGGAWLVSSLAQADFPTLPELVFGPENARSSEKGGFGGWVTQFDILEPSTNGTIVEEYLTELVEEAVGKAIAGFPVTLADIWARALSRHFDNGTTLENIMDSSLKHGAGILLSSLPELSSFMSFEQPFPMFVVDSLSSGGNASNIFPGGNLVPLTNPLYEFNVYEMGSYDPMLSAFTPTKYLGSRNDSLCTTGFDQLSFVQASSSMILNEEESSTSGGLATALEAVIEILTDIIAETGLQLDTATYPNPFYGLSAGTYIDSGKELLTLVDGGEDGENIPFQPLLVKAREVEVILAIDASNDVEGFSDGSAVIATQERVQEFFPHAYAFPPVPTNQSGFLADNLTTAPAFFGCASSPAGAPLVIYLANGGAPPGQAPLTNTSTTQLSYDPSEVQAMLDQIVDIATQGRRVDGAPDPEWPACLACAVVDRARERLGRARSGVCSSCMERYCWVPAGDGS